MNRESNLREIHRKSPLKRDQGRSHADFPDYGSNGTQRIISDKVSKLPKFGDPAVYSLFYATSSEKKHHKVSEGSTLGERFANVSRSLIHRVAYTSSSLRRESITVDTKTSLWLRNSSLTQSINRRDVAAF